MVALCFSVLFSFVCSLFVYMLSSRLYVLFIVYVFSLHLSVLSLFLSSHCICLFSFRFWILSSFVCSPVVCLFHLFLCSLFVCLFSLFVRFCLTNASCFLSFHVIKSFSSLLGRLCSVVTGYSGILHICFSNPLIWQSNYKNCYVGTVELQWLEHLWDHRKLFETWVVRATEG